MLLYCNLSYNRLPHLVDAHGGSLGKVPLDVLQEHISGGASNLLHLGAV